METSSSLWLGKLANLNKDRSRGTAPGTGSDTVSEFQNFRFQHFSFYSPVDIFTPQKRSEVMSRIRGRDTKPEFALRSMLHRLGYRFTVKGPKNKSLPGRPDIVLPKYRTVIFVHGCFWHGHEHCPAFRLPSTRRE